VWFVMLKVQYKMIVTCLVLFAVHSAEIFF